MSIYQQAIAEGKVIVLPSYDGGELHVQWGQRSGEDCLTMVAFGPKGGLLGATQLLGAEAGRLAAFITKEES